jgi:hypothetical protein
VGTLQYDGVLVEFDDRLLVHLQFVIVKKIQRGESFLMSWRDSEDVGDGRSSVWIHPAQNLYFKFVGGHDVTLNPVWLDRLLASANSSRGLVIMEEPDDPEIVTPAANGRAFTNAQRYTKVR